MAAFSAGFLREADGSLTVTTDATGALYLDGFLRSPTGALVVTTSTAGATMQDDFLRAANGALVVNSGGTGTEIAGFLRDTNLALVVASSGGTGRVAGFARDASLRLVVTGLAAANYAPTILATAGLTNYWRLDETAGPSADSKGTASLTWSGSPTFGVAGLLTTDPDKAISLPGAALGAASGSYPNVAPFSVEAWVQPSSITGSHRWVGTGTAGGWACGSSGGNLLFTTFAVQDYTSVSAYLTLGVKHHVVAVFKANFAVDFYVDGAFKETVAGPANPNAAAGGVQIGARGDGTETFAGVLDEVAIYNVALSGATILAHFNAA